MKVVLLSVGKTDNDLFSNIIEEYRTRVNFYLHFDIEYVSSIKNRKGMSVNKLKQEEGKKILGSLQPTDQVVLLDDKGKQLNSLAFADYIQKKMTSVPKRLVFVVGGPYGFAPEIYEIANELLSLSTMTFTHQMIRMVFAEQLYRAMTILNNEPYHHE